MKLAIPIIATILALTLAKCLDACTAFCIRGGETIILAKNLDWPISDGLIFVNKRGVNKTAFSERSTRLSWTSRYGSITFNQFGKEFPLGGMNEEGLVIEELNAWGEYPARDSLPGLNEFQWIQYQLDNYSSTAEMILHLPEIDIEPLLANIHYLVCDRSGHAAVIEYYGNKVHVYEGRELPYAVLSNNHYDNSLAYLENFKGFGGNMTLARENTSGERFARAAALTEKLRDTDKTPVPADAFGILDSVRQEDTQWSIVYDIMAMEIHVRTSACGDVQVVDVNSPDLSGNPTAMYRQFVIPCEDFQDGKFKKFDPAMNTALLESVYRKYEALKLGSTGREVFLSLAAHGNSVGGRQ